MPRTKGAKDTKPRAKRGTVTAAAAAAAQAVREEIIVAPRRRGRPPGVSSATKRAMAQAESDMRGHNGIDPGAVAKLRRTYFEQEDRLDTFRAEYMNRCKGPRTIQKEAFDDAKEAGVPIRAARAMLKMLMYDRSKAKLRAKLEPDDTMHVDTMLGLEGLPLGEATLEREKQEAEAEKDAAALAVMKQVAENEARLTSGIRELDGGWRGAIEDLENLQFTHGQT